MEVEREAREQGESAFYCVMLLVADASDSRFLIHTF